MEINEEFFQSHNTNELELMLLNMDLNCKHSKGDTTLHLLARYGHADLLKKILNSNLSIMINEQNDNGETIFLIAAANGMLNILELLKTKGADITCHNVNKENALHLAAREGHSQIVEKLVSWKIKINKRNVLGETPLMLAAQNGHDAILIILLNRKRKVNRQCTHGRTSLWYAAANGHLLCVQKLVDHGADTDIVDNEGITPLMCAAKSNKFKILKLLLASGAAINDQCKYGRSAFHYAAFFTNLKCAKILLKTKCDANLRDVEGRTPLMAALYHGNNELVDYLLRFVKLSVQCKIGRTALHYAAAKGQQRNCVLLVNAGATIDVKDNYGNTPLMLAAMRGYITVVGCLLEKGADLSIRDNERKTALMKVVQSRFIKDHEVIQDVRGPIVDFEETIACLIVCGNDIDAFCIRGQTALHYAAANGHLDCVRQLLDANAWIDCTDNRGETPLHKAADKRVISLLIKRGASQKESIVGKAVGNATSLKKVTENSGYANIAGESSGSFNRKNNRQ